MVKKHGANVLLNIGTVLLSVSVAILFAEIGCRFIELTNDTDPTYKLSHPILPYVMKQNTESVSLLGHKIAINSHGLRDFDYSSAKESGTYRVVVLGDSTTFGYGQEVEDSFPKVLEKRLNSLVPNKKYRKVEVINTGHPGFNTIDEYNFLNIYGINYSPDALIVGVMSNDFTYQSENYVIRDGIASNPGSFWVRLNIPPWVTRILRKSSLYVTVGNAYKRIQFSMVTKKKVDENGNENRKTKEVVNTYLNKLVSFASARHLPITFIFLPTAQEVALNKHAYPELIESLKDISNNANVSFLDGLEDLQPFSESTGTVFPEQDDVHPNPRGHQIYADRLYRSFAPVVVTN